ncbi:MAG: hypothetical protein COU42_01470 [Candidatus Nealsonbacteria bacterium CG10_big_fil_rev_8_21_14_0_10_36_24]|uniref:Methyltransferase type 11 domain-containing protein n=2 Tax=Candidatus Nealsoniibacteriota TaxID=1817911 RepID=A0A2H0YNK4_9BACT|nr:MAG: hypothetical protein COU42_01470 [Candidatus Nealsonbacteria bacterium CG10_big_fil_rev_8_21_14_0_10_36_24]PIS40071.1 MAG: hypothetical protein COT32_01635 [Candidatus Nealsonbacteria bacterium CG08_land_8_20_14_0_20_36_22]
MNIARNGLIIFCSKVIIAVLLFLPQIILARKLGPDGLGVYNLFLTISGISLLLGNLGVGNASIYLMNKKKESPVQLFSNSLIFGVLWGIILSGLFYLIYLVFPSLVSGLSKGYVFLAILVIPIILLYNYLLPFLLAKFQIFKWSFFSILYAGLILLGVVILVEVFDFGTTGAIYAVVFSCVFSLCVVFIYLLKLFSLKLHFDKNLFGKEIRFGISSYLGDVFNGKKINFMLNLFIINIFLGMTDVGYYSVAFSITTILFFIPYSFQQILYSAWSLSSEEEIDKKTPEVGRQILILGFLSAIFFALIGKYFIILFYGKEFYPSIVPFFLILPGFIFITFASVFFNNFFAKGKPYIASCILICAITINIFLNLLLIPMIGIKGAAISVSISYFIVAVLAILFFAKTAKIPFKKIIKIQWSDFKPLFNEFERLFKGPGRLLTEIPDLNLKKLKDYYEKKAINGPNVIEQTFKSSKFYKRIFYSNRVDKVMEMLDIEPQDKILELACGEGYYTRQIAAVTLNLIATDISQHYLDKSKSYNPYKIIDYACCPVEELPFADNSFDKILMSEVIEHLLDWRSGIKEIKRVLKPGGKLIITTPNKYSYLNLLCHLRARIRNRPFDEEHIKEFSRKELEKSLEKYFNIEKFSYTNYFPVFLPKFLLKIIKFQRTKKIIQKIEGFFEKIPVVREAGLIIIIRVVKPKLK